MTTKNYGAGLSGYRDPEGRNWESTVFQAGKAVTDSELVLVQDTEQEAELSFRRRSIPSGWLSTDFLNTSNSISIFGVSAVANELKLDQRLVAHVNGWLLRVSHTGGLNTNKLSLGAAPVGAGTKRTDLVILEVWRKLVSPSPSTDGKSPMGRIWWNGNVKIDAADDAGLNFADDILDALVAAETTKRVQIQYRLRVVQDVDLFATPYGMDDPAVVARTVPPNAATPDGNATAFAYTNQSSNGDPGLWRAGDGNPANGIGSVDGYMYALPLVAVFRRNQTAFDRNTNHNGGSGRPDSLTHDIIVANDVMDLRFGVSPAGWNYQELLERNFNLLLDNAVRTEIMTSPHGGGVEGHLPIWADEIGISNANGGDGVTTGDTPGAALIGQFDATRRRFSDRSVHETLVLRYTPADIGMMSWSDNDSITIDFTALPVYPYAAFNWAAYAPSGVMAVDLQIGWFMGKGGMEVRRLLGVDHVVQNLGSLPIASLTLDIGTVPMGVTDEDLILYLVVSYPSGVGLSKTPAVELGVAGITINNPAQLPNMAPIWFDQMQDRDIDTPHREVFLTYKTLSLSLTLSANDEAGFSNDDIILPDRAISVSSIDINGMAYAGAITISSDGYTVSLDPGSLMPGDDVDIDFVAVRPLPQNDEQLTVYYNVSAPQTVRELHLPASLNVIPRYVSPYLYSMTVGSGSQDYAYPFDVQYTQMPGVYPTSGGTFSGEHELSAYSGIAVKSFSASTGFLKLEAKIPMVANPQDLTFTRDPGDVDIEDRSYYKGISGGVYLPNAYAEPLIDPKRHRCVLPILAELPADSTLGYKGQLVLVVLGAWLSPGALAPSADNSVAFNPTLNANVTSASVYRIKGNLLNNRVS